VPRLLGTFLFVIAGDRGSCPAYLYAGECRCGALAGVRVVRPHAGRGFSSSWELRCLIAACFFAMTILGVFPPRVPARGLVGWRFGVAVTANFGWAVMCVASATMHPTIGSARTARNRIPSPRIRS